jgi:pentose-5-phosphate-3-epimerase
MLFKYTVVLAGITDVSRRDPPGLGCGRRLHLDIMDAHFVRTEFGPDMVVLARSVSPVCNRNVHLMMTSPVRYLDRLSTGRSDGEIHVEGDCDVWPPSPHRRRGVRGGLVARPQTRPRRLPVPAACDECFA